MRPAPGCKAVLHQFSPTHERACSSSPPTASQSGSLRVIGTGPSGVQRSGAGPSGVQGCTSASGVGAAGHGATG
eukprot:537022-Alexandrium_andersonii.AAC.1